jgi:hypothetical protein
MNAEQLKKILEEYSPSMKLKIIVDREVLIETTVIETVLKVQYEDLKCRPGDRPVTVLTIFGRSDCIVRERGDFTDDVAGAPPYKRWLELDLR